MLQEKIRVNGYDMAFVESGRGAALVLLHGTLCDWRFWGTQMTPLGQDFRVIAVSLRHYYPERWDGIGDDFSISQHIDDVIAFIDAQGLRPVHLLGHSRGGNVAFHLAARHREHIRSLILAEPGGELDETLRAGPAPVRVDYFQKIAAWVSGGDIDGGLAQILEFLGGKGAWERIPEAGRQMFRDNVGTFCAQIAETRPPFSRAAARAIGVPTLLIGGAASPAPFPEILDALERTIANVRRVTIPNAAHPMNAQNPQPFNAAVAAFLANVEAGASAVSASAR
jgi:pimeloyl-ACP methyl ester carboxylesterase